MEWYYSEVKPGSIMQPVCWLQTLQSVFLLNRSLLLSEPVCGGPFEGRISCIQHFLLSWVSMGPLGWLKLVSLAAPQQANWLMLKCLACIFSFPWSPWAKFVLFPGETWWLPVGWYGSKEGCAHPSTLPHPTQHAQGVAQRTMRKCLSHASCAASLLNVYTWALPHC